MPATLQPAQSTGPIFIVTFDTYRRDRRSTGTYELDFDRMTETMLVRDILGSQFEDIDRVYEAHPDEGTFRDVTEDIAMAVAQLAYADTRHPHHEIRNWIETHIGCEKALRILPVEAA